MERDAQSAWAGVGEDARLVVLPRHDVEAMPGVRWGTPDVMNTPAYWAVRCRWPGDAIPSFVGSNVPLVEEVGFCLLGGFGIRYEVNQAAFDRLRDNAVFDPHSAVLEGDIRELLLQPLSVQGRQVRYRFPKQRSRRIHLMRKRLHAEDFSGLKPLALRARLMDIEGIGPKTASWIVRNHCGADQVAIIDIHVIRACTRMNVFPETFHLPRDYATLEQRFLEFAEAIDVQASVLDAVMWSEMRSSGAQVPSLG